ncbi:hypothetical protein RB195_001973 [Necator americanus]|uniref:Uncharacterized protein n=2 Tax=Necator americanus TaxID=51031 RepID=A0ABR1DI99_NECAM|nr:hypothetical protein NECAME_11854 [Necator americanus]ETN76188.1 hypothetical protein NECAME_11854 [Necator americanus]
MRVLVFILAVGAVLADYQSQNSGYETAEKSQPPPEYPPSSNGGDQQGYNSDGAANDAPPPRYQPGGGNGGGVPGVQTPDINIKVPGVQTPDIAPPVEVKPVQPIQPSYPPPGPGPAPYKDSQQYPANANYQQGEQAQPAPHVSAQGGDGLAYSNEVRLRARRF